MTSEDYGSSCCQGLGVPVGILAAVQLVGQAPWCLLYHLKNNMPPCPRAVYQVTGKPQDKGGHIPANSEVTVYWLWEVKFGRAGEGWA